MKKSIGFIGLGSMGKPMAENLLQAGFPVIVTYHTNKLPAEHLSESGAKMVDTVQEVAALSDIVITILPADKEITQVYTAPNGLLKNMKQGSICIDMTSAKGQTIQQVADLAEEKGIQLLDAPVSGGIPGAINGKLTIMVGGEEKLLEQCRPILEVMGEKIYYTGGLGSGKAVKMINQLLNAGNTYIASEAVFLAKQLNLDMDIFQNVVKQSSGGSYVFENAVSKAIIPEKFDAGFKLDLMKKDVGLSIEQAEQLEISLPIMKQIYQAYQEISEQDQGNKHYGVVSKWVEQQNK
jgi:3-hydroxyisobutyrate dehydrogenase-like beta-hydroxyacid dehydrogenase